MDNDFKTRADAFIKDYGDLVAKHNIDFAHYPVYMPDGAGGFRTVLQTAPVDISKNEQFVTSSKEPDNVSTTEKPAQA